MIHLMSSLRPGEITWSSERTVRVVVEGDVGSAAIRAQRLNAWVEALRTGFADRLAIIDVAACDTTITLTIDPARSLDLSFNEVEEKVHALCETSMRVPLPRRSVIELPTVYGGTDGPDLDSVCDHTGLSQSEVIDRHSRGMYTVSHLGFAPGFAYLVGLDPLLATPRLDTPRTRVPAGSVGIAGLRTGCYPLSLPGGWRLIGKTRVALFNSQKPRHPAPYQPGDQVRFVPVRAHTEGLATS
ncbi:MAG: 5-oxoprolinase subunit PxpB [Planctomycetota bacterium]